MDPDLRKIQSDELIVYDVELSEYIQRKMNRIQAVNVDLILLEQALNNANITDPRIRAEHVEKAGSAGKQDR